MNKVVRLFCCTMLTVTLSSHAISASDAPSVRPLPNAHSHNDYHQPRPLHAALERGFCSVEADIYLLDGQLLVGHEPAELRTENTLERLYLIPLQERVRAHGGRVYPGGPLFTLLIDIKSDGPATYAALRGLLEKYREMIAAYDERGELPGAVQVVVSGNCPRPVIAADPLRLARIDGRLTDLNSGESAQRMPLISDRWTAHFQWRGEGEFSKEEQDKLLSIVRQAHAAGRRVRFWATPEEPRLWHALQAAGVDHINTDRLDQLSDHLRQNAPVRVVLWNGARLFDQATVAKRANDLREFGKYFHDADVVVLDEVTSVEVVMAARDAMGFAGYQAVCSDFAQDDFDTYNSLEVGLLSRFPVANVLEFDQTTDNTGASGEPVEKPLDQVDVAGLVKTSAPRGILSVDIPELQMTVVATHLKSSRGLSGEQDLENAQMREYVAAAMASHAVDRLAADSNWTVLVAGDMNVGETDVSKNGQSLTDDHVQVADGDLYDETHAIFSGGLVRGLRMTSLTRSLGLETFDDPRFAGAGPIDCLYVAGARADQFAPAQRSLHTFGSDHFAVSTRLGGPAEERAPIVAEMEDAPVEINVRIVGLMPNPKGVDEGHEWVELKNLTSADVDVTGWTLMDRARNRLRLSGTLAAGEVRRFDLPAGSLPLNNNGDEIILMNAAGQRLQAVDYGKEQATAGAEIRPDLPGKPRNAPGPDRN